MDLDWNDIYIFLERHSGLSYDFSDEFSRIGGYEIFINPYEWIETVDLILENLEDALECIEDWSDEIPDYMPGKDDLKKIMSESILSLIIKNINDTKRTLGIDRTTINGYDNLFNQAHLLAELVTLINESTIDDIIKSDIFNSDKDEDNIVNIFNIHKRDIPNMCITVRSIRNDYFESFNEDDE